ncbi:hypothetical protein N7535_001460 [Penicillium sp. DV-2018c]|nr:hypothetical protein N7461_005295 [Penicillium sp. DV-2018c]KAJ5582840.1 hypothetical protein N7535_001460 [Penicillium sp. DV-2018c]
MRDRWTKWRMCMIIDEESLQTLKGTSAEALENESPYCSDDELRCVKVLEAFPETDQGIVSPAIEKSMGEINEYDTGPVAIWRTYHHISRFEIGEPNVLLKDPAVKVHNRLQNAFTD